MEKIPSPSSERPLRGGGSTASEEHQRHRRRHVSPSQLAEASFNSDRRQSVKLQESASVASSTRSSRLPMRRSCPGSTVGGDHDNHRNTMGVASAAGASMRSDRQSEAFVATATPNSSHYSSFKYSEPFDPAPAALSHGGAPLLKPDSRTAAAPVTDEEETVEGGNTGSPELMSTSHMSAPTAATAVPPAVEREIQWSRGNGAAVAVNDDDRTASRGKRDHRASETASRSSDHHRPHHDHRHRHHHRHDSAKSEEEEGRGREGPSRPTASEVTSSKAHSDGGTERLTADAQKGSRRHSQHRGSLIDDVEAFLRPEALVQSWQADMASRRQSLPQEKRRVSHDISSASEEKSTTSRRSSAPKPTAVVAPLHSSDGQQMDSVAIPRRSSASLRQQQVEVGSPTRSSISPRNTSPSIPASSENSFHCHAAPSAPASAALPSPEQLRATESTRWVPDASKNRASSLNDSVPRSRSSVATRTSATPPQRQSVAVPQQLRTPRRSASSSPASPHRAATSSGGLGSTVRRGGTPLAPASRATSSVSPSRARRRGSVTSRATTTTAAQPFSFVLDGRSPRPSVVPDRLSVIPANELQRLMELPHANSRCSIGTSRLDFSRDEDVREYYRQKYTVDPLVRTRPGRRQFYIPEQIDLFGMYGLPAEPVEHPDISPTQPIPINGESFVPPSPAHRRAVAKAAPASSDAPQSTAATPTTIKTTNTATNITTTTATTAAPVSVVKPARRATGGGLGSFAMGYGEETTRGVARITAPRGRFVSDITAMQRGRSVPISPSRSTQSTANSTKNTASTNTPTPAPTNNANTSSTSSTPATVLSNTTPTASPQRSQPLNIFSWEEPANTTAASRRKSETAAKLVLKQPLPGTPVDSGNVIAPDTVNDSTVNPLAPGQPSTTAASGEGAGAFRPGPRVKEDSTQTDVVLVLSAAEAVQLRQSNPELFAPAEEVHTISPRRRRGAYHNGSGEVRKSLRWV